MVSPTPLYPVLGVAFFLQHPKQLWLKTLLPFLLTLGFGVVSLFISFAYLLPWQAHFFIKHHIPNWIAHTIACILSIIESGILDILCFAILLPFFQDAVFDATLKARRLERMLDDADVSKLVTCCRGITSSLFATSLVVLARVIILILTLPLNIIPVIGTVLACYINAFPATWSLVLHYDIELRGMTVTESRKHAWHNKLHFINFGVVSVALEMIPIINLLFMWTNIVGVALWISDIYLLNERLTPEEAAARTLYPPIITHNDDDGANEASRLLPKKDQDYGSSV
ncbi:unnamed protein product [Cunninghamella blakesleeana]